MDYRCSRLNGVIHKWRGIVEQVEDLGEKVLTLSRESGDSLSESVSLMTDVNCLVSRFRDKYLSSKRERDEIQSYLSEVEEKEMEAERAKDRKARKVQHKIYAGGCCPVAARGLDCCGCQGE